MACREKEACWPSWELSRISQDGGLIFANRIMQPENQACSFKQNALQDFLLGFLAVLFQVLSALSEQLHHLFWLQQLEVLGSDQATLDKVDRWELLSPVSHSCALQHLPAPQPPEYAAPPQSAPKTSK